MENLYLKQYRDTYGHYNDETLVKATTEDPELVKKIVMSSEIIGLARAYSVLALARGSKQEHFEFIKSCVSDESPFVREAAFMGLFEYQCADSSNIPNLKDFFEECLKNETGEGVIKTIEGLLADWSLAYLYKDN